MVPWTCPLLRSSFALFPYCLQNGLNIPLLFHPSMKTGFFKGFKSTTFAINLYEPRSSIQLSDRVRDWFNYFPDFFLNPIPLSRFTITYHWTGCRRTSDSIPLATNCNECRYVKNAQTGECLKECPEDWEQKGIDCYPKSCKFSSVSYC